LSLKRLEAGVQVFRYSGVQEGKADDRPPTTDHRSPSGDSPSIPEHLNT